MKLFFPLSLSLSLSLSAALHAQHFQAGLNGGIATSQVHGDNLSGFNKAGVAAGGFVKRILNDKWDALFEINYVQKGSRKIPNPAKGDYRSYLLRLDYAEVPVVIRFKIQKQIALETGFAFAGLVREKEINNEINMIQTQQSAHFNKTDFSFIIGLNYLFKTNVDFIARYTNSFLPIREFSAGPVYYQNWFFNLFNRGFYNNVLTFTARYTFSPKKETSEQPKE